MKELADRKQRLYAELLDRLQAAREAGFHYEACWFAHAIFEDRTRSILANSGDPKDSGDKISARLAVILGRIDKTVANVVGGKAVKDKRTGNKQKTHRWPNLQTFSRKLIEDVQQWTVQRNDLSHKLASGLFLLKDADRLAAQLSEDGLTLSKEICTAARRVKKRSKSQAKA